MAQTSVADLQGAFTSSNDCYGLTFNRVTVRCSLGSVSLCSSTHVLSSSTSRWLSNCTYSSHITSRSKSKSNFLNPTTSPSGLFHRQPDGQAARPASALPVLLPPCGLCWKHMVQQAIATSTGHVGRGYETAEIDKLPDLATSARPVSATTAAPTPVLDATLPAQTMTPAAL